MTADPSSSSPRDPLSAIKDYHARPIGAYRAVEELKSIHGLATVGIVSKAIKLSKQRLYQVLAEIKPFWTEFQFLTEQEPTWSHLIKLTEAQPEDRLEVWVRALALAQANGARVPTVRELERAMGEVSATVRAQRVTEAFVRLSDALLDFPGYDRMLPAISALRDNLVADILSPGNTASKPVLHSPDEANCRS